jgi:hypothetical protein
MIQGTVKASSFLNCGRRAIQKPKRYEDHTVASHDKLHEIVHDRLKPRPRYIGRVRPNSKLTPPYIRLHPTQWQTRIRFLIAKTTPSENPARSAKWRHQPRWPQQPHREHALHVEVYKCSHGTNGGIAIGWFTSTGMLRNTSYESLLIYFQHSDQTKENKRKQNKTFSSNAHYL